MNLHGGGTKGGGTKGGGTKGLSADEGEFVNALGDVYATPVFCEAMTTAREACIDPADQVAWDLEERWTRSQGHIMRWDPWVRSYLCSQDLISSISFQSGTIRDGLFPHGSHPERRFQVTLLADLPIAPDDEHGGYPHGHACPKRPLVTLIRPAPHVFKAQTAQVIAWAELRQERMPEILTQIQNTYAFWGSLIPIQTDRLRATRELLDAAVQFAMFAEMRMKNELATWRPTDYSAQVQPVVTTPGHGSLPCGHCTEAYVIKEVLQSLLRMDRTVDRHKGLREQFSRVAARLSMNRVIAGLHFPVDNLAGRLLGKVLGRYFVLRCGGYWPASQGPQIKYGIFRGDKCHGHETFDPGRQEIFYPTHHSPSPAFYEVRPIEGFDPAALDPDGILGTMWRRAQAELKLLQLPFD
jgi:hypothetical protein